MFWSYYEFAMKNGIMIISLDFELHWGVFESVSNNSPYMNNLLQTPIVIDQMLDLFDKKRIPVTWAIVGFLFGESRDMIKNFEPEIKPCYNKSIFNPYLISTGKDENDDPIHFAPSLIKKIMSFPYHELATHTFSHFQCRSEAATIESFLADLDSSIKIADQYGIKYKSIVFPRNQLIREYIDLLPEKGITTFRGAEKGWMYTGIKHFNDRRILKIRQFVNKLGRILDSYIPFSGPNVWSLEELTTKPGQPINVPASRFVRPYNSRLKYLEWLKLLRIKYQILNAAKRKRMVHLRWHPHNFGSDIDKNIRLIEKIIDCFEYCKRKYNMKCMTVAEYSAIIKSFSESSQNSVI